MRRLVAIAAMSLGIAGQVAAADVTSAVLSVDPGSQPNSVLVNSTGQFEPVGGASETLPTGSRVLLRTGGEGTLTYSDGCVVHLRPGETAIVHRESPCSQPHGYAPQEAAWHPDGWLIGAGALGGLVLVGCGFGGCFDNHHHLPRSP